jgi:hypothetical protein
MTRFKFLLFVALLVGFADLCRFLLEPSMVLASQQNGSGPGEYQFKNAVMTLAAKATIMVPAG